MEIGEREIKTQKRLLNLFDKIAWLHPPSLSVLAS